jgi:hypothetical protein
LALTLIFAPVLFHDKALVFKGPNVDGLFACSAYKVYGKIIAEQRYQPAGQRAVLGLKDANLALAVGEAVGVPLPSGKRLARSPGGRTSTWRGRVRLGCNGERSGESERVGLVSFRRPRPIPCGTGKNTGNCCKGRSKAPWLVVVYGATALEKLLQIGFEQDFDQIQYRSELLGRATSRSTCDAH